jgi:cytochrome oxidase assembly protein ShyY1
MRAVADGGVTDPDLLMAWDREARGIPIGRPAEVNLRNNHTQYIFTWYVTAHEKPEPLETP